MHLMKHKLLRGLKDSKKKSGNVKKKKNNNGNLKNSNKK